MVCGKKSRKKFLTRRGGSGILIAMSNLKPEDILTVEAAAELLRRDIGYIYRAERKGLLHRLPIDGKAYLFARRDVEKLAEALKRAEEEIMFLKAKSASENVVQLRKDIKKLQEFLVPAKKLLRLTCNLRQEAMAVTKLAEDLNKKDGVNLFAFLQSLEESELLKNGL